MSADSDAPSDALGAGELRSRAFQEAADLVLDYLKTHLPMGFWSITRVENDRQTYLYLEENVYGLSTGGSHAWQDSYCVHMVAGTAPQIAPDASAVPQYAAAAVNDAIQIGAYAGSPIAEPDGSLFGVICGLDTTQRPDIASYEPLLTLLSELLRVTLHSDRVCSVAEFATRTALTDATTDALTGLPNRRAWQEMITRLDDDYAAYADPTVVVIADLDNLKAVNDGPGGHAAGDTLLRTAAGVMRETLRERDFLARIGGDEFGIVLTACPVALAPQITARLSSALLDAGAPASLGWSPITAARLTERAIVLADEAMYAVKSQRRSARRRARAE